MCFGGKPKLSPPKMQPITQSPVTPIADQTPAVQGGADASDAARNAKRAKNPNQALSMFQIQLVPGAGTSTDTPGAATSGVS